jgi:hypothetical protein
MSPELSLGCTSHQSRGVTLGSLARDVGYDKHGYGGTARTLLDLERVSLAYGTEGSGGRKENGCRSWDVVQRLIHDRFGPLQEHEMPAAIVT